MGQLRRKETRVHRAITTAQPHSDCDSNARHARTFITNLPILGKVGPRQNVINVLLVTPRFPQQGPNVGLGDKATVVTVHLIKGLGESILGNVALRLERRREKLGVVDDIVAIDVNAVKDLLNVLFRVVKLRQCLLKLGHGQCSRLQGIKLVKDLAELENLVRGGLFGNDIESEFAKVAHVGVLNHALSDALFEGFVDAAADAAMKAVSTFLLLHPGVLLGLGGRQTLVGLYDEQALQKGLGIGGGSFGECIVASEDLGHDLLGRLSIKGLLSIGQQHVSDDSETPNVGLEGINSLERLRTHTVERPDAFGENVIGRRILLGETKVNDFDGGIGMIGLE